MPAAPNVALTILKSFASPAELTATEHSSEVQALLETTQIQHVQSSDRAFAAILADGTVCCWGDGNFGGDSCSVQEQLVNVKQIKVRGCRVWFRMK